MLNRNCNCLGTIESAKNQSMPHYTIFVLKLIWYEEFKLGQQLYAKSLGNVFNFFVFSMDQIYHLYIWFSQQLKPSFLGNHDLM